MRSREEIEKMIDGNPDDEGVVEMLTIELLLDIRDLLSSQLSVQSKATGFRPMSPPKVLGG